MIFLVSYDRGTQRLTQPLETFEPSERAIARRRRHEIQLGLPVEEGRYEVVLLEAPSEEAIRKTHARYFAESEHALIEDARTEIRAHENASRRVTSGPSEAPAEDRSDT